MRIHKYLPIIVTALALDQIHAQTLTSVMSNLGTQMSQFDQFFKALFT